MLCEKFSRRPPQTISAQWPAEFQNKLEGALPQCYPGRMIKRSLMLLLFSCAAADAASIGWAPSPAPAGSPHSGGGYSITSVASLMLSPTPDLTPELPIEITFHPRLSGANGEFRSLSSALFRDVITMSAMIGEQTVSVSTIYQLAIPDRGQAQFDLYPEVPSFSMTVPWDTDPALTMTVTHDAFLSGDRAKILNLWAPTDFIIITRSIPELSTATAVMAAALLLNTTSRRRPRPPVV